MGFLSELQFQDRHDAGRVLAKLLQGYADHPNAIVLGLPRGGVPVAFEVAAALRLPLDVFVVRKLGVPGYEELAMGALASGGIRVLNTDVLAQISHSEAALATVTSSEARELERREKAYRGATAGPPDLSDKIVILVDDGLATGATMRVALRAVQQRGVARCVVAVPVASEETWAQFQDEADEIVCAIVARNFHAVGQFYCDFRELLDADVRGLLAAASKFGIHTPK